MNVDVQHNSTKVIEGEEADSRAEVEHAPGRAAILGEVGAGHVAAHEHAFGIVRANGGIELRAASVVVGAEREGEIVAEAGQPGAVTIATNMAGRGVDIKLGGNAEHRTHLALTELGLEQGSDDYDKEWDDLFPRIERQIEADREKVLEAGGLFILGTERHESRRIDNQLRGRSGRQGDPGESLFYISAEDDLVRLFAGDRIYRILDRLGPVSKETGEEEPLDSKMLTKQIESAQKKVEEQNFLIRKRVL